MGVPSIQNKGDAAILSKIPDDVKRLASNFLTESMVIFYITNAKEELVDEFDGLKPKNNIGLGENLIVIRYQKRGSIMVAVRLLTEKELLEQTQIAFYKNKKPIKQREFVSKIPLCVLMFNTGEGGKSYTQTFANNAKDVAREIEVDADDYYNALIETVSTTENQRKEIQNMYNRYKKKYGDNFSALLIAFNEGFYQYYDKKQPLVSAYAAGEEAADNVELSPTRTLMW